ncbi:hypothetical protein SAY87_023728 [Trapa incisa]|uniref:Uncharacterized protein n=1 Tax=Trapa incisa TaxID=236973 RepID=A0AAN7KY94_9MYRT|nr:hypothetical protein SAY87_023728 [Trapa incisa]
MSLLWPILWLIPPPPSHSRRLPPLSRGIVAYSRRFGFEQVGSKNILSRVSGNAYQSTFDQELGNVRRLRTRFKNEKLSADAQRETASQTIYLIKILIHMSLPRIISNFQLDLVEIRTCLGPRLFVRVQQDPNSTQPDADPTLDGY